MAKKQATSRTNAGQFPPGVSGNPLGRQPRADAGVPVDTHEFPSGIRWDGWQSVLTGLGTAMFDKRLDAQFVVEPVSDEEAQSIYRGDDCGARLVDLWPQHMLREGFELCIAELTAEKVKEATDKAPPTTRQDARRRARYDSKERLRLDASAAKAKDLSERAMKKFAALGGRERFKEAIAYSRAYGGGAILIGAVDSSKDWSKPLNLDTVRDLKFLTSLEPRELTPIAYYEDPLEDKFGQPMLYQITPTTPSAGAMAHVGSKIIYVHESRLIVFQGIKVTRNQVSPRMGFGDSVYTRAKPILRDFNIGWAGAAIILQEFSLATMKIKGLAEMVSADAQKKLLARMAAVQLGRSIAKLTLLDTTEEFGRDMASVAGLADLLTKLAERLAACFGIPVELLMGLAPSGLNANGASGIRNFYDLIAAAQVEILEPALVRIFEIIFRALGGKVPAKWSIDFKPLWQESPKEQAETRAIIANTDEKNILNGIYTSEEARRSHFGGDKFSAEIVIDDVDDGYEPSDEVLEGHKAAITPPTDPNAPAPAPAPAAPPTGGAPAPVGNPGDTIPINAPEKPVSNAGLNGAQIASMMEVIKAAAAGELDRGAAKTILLVSFPVDDATAEKLLGDPNFKPKEPPPAPFGGGGGFGGPKPPAPGGPEPKPGDEKPAGDAPKAELEKPEPKA